MVGLPTIGYLLSDDREVIDVVETDGEKVIGLFDDAMEGRKEGIFDGANVGKETLGTTVGVKLGDVGTELGMDVG